MPHDPRTDDFSRFKADAAGLIKGYDGLSWQQKACAERFADYYHNPSLIPQLAYFEDKHNLDGSNRLHRSERRAAHALILCAIALRTDFGSSQIGNPMMNGDFYFASLVELAEIAGLALTEGEEEDEQIVGVSQRFARAWRDLVAAKVVGQVERFQEVLVMRNGRKQKALRAVNSIKIINPQIFVQIGALTKSQLKHMQEYARNIRVKVPTKAQGAESIRKIYKRKPRMTKRVKAFMDSAWRQMLRIYRELKNRFPGQDVDWYRTKVSAAFPS